MNGSMLLVHGAGSGPWVFRSWGRVFRDVELVSVDLNAGLDMEKASMSDYRAAVLRAAARMTRPLHLCGWSMGGLVALMAAEEAEPDALALLEASPPAEIQGFHDIEPAEGTFDPQEVYGEFPPGMFARDDSQFARDERKRGISVPSVSCPCLVVYGDEFPDERGKKIADLYGADVREAPGLSHWGLVTETEVPTMVRAWIEDL